MGKVFVAVILLLSYVLYSFVVYTRGTEIPLSLQGKEAQQVIAGKQLYQKHNCVACHQLYGLGGYLGPELTTAWSDPQRGELYMRAFLQAGGRTMPNFHFTANEINQVIAYLRYVDSTAITYKTGP